MKKSPNINVPRWLPCPSPTDDTIKLVNAAIRGLNAICRPGFRYKKSGVLLMALQPKESVQPTLFDDSAEQSRSDNMMRVMDRINNKMGAGTLTVAASGTAQRWAMRRESTSPSYTTEWGELPEAW